MSKPLSVRPVTNTEQPALQEGGRSADAFVVRRSQILVASARGQHARAIAPALGGADQTVRNAIPAVNAWGVRALQRRSSAPHQTPHAVFTPTRCEQGQALLPQSPRGFSKPTRVWTLDLAAAVAYATGILPRRVSGETVRTALARLNTRWKRANHWMTSPDPA